MKIRRRRISQKGRIETYNRKGNLLVYGNIGLKVIKEMRLTELHIKIIQLTILKFIDKNIKIIFRVKPTISFTSKGILIRMGKGKGKIKGIYSRINKGTIILELREKKKERLSNMKLALKKVIKKFPIFTIISKPTI